MNRTTIAVTDDQIGRLRVMASSRGTTISDLIRQAIDAYLLESADHQNVLERTLGAIPDIDVPRRTEWERPTR